VQKGRAEVTKDMIKETIKEAFTSTEPEMVELRKQMFVSVMSQQGEASVQMGPGTSELRRYPVDEITEPILGDLHVPWGRTGRKKIKVAEGIVKPPNPEARYGGMPIPTDYALVDVAWTADEFEGQELDYPTEWEGITTIGSAIIGMTVLWNKADIDLKPKERTPPPPQPPSSPPGGPSDDDDGNGGDDSAPGSSGDDNAPPPDTSNPQGGNETPPPSAPKDKGQCPPAPKKATSEEEGIPPNMTKEDWAAFKIAEVHKYSTEFDRYVYANGNPTVNVFYVPR